MKINASPKKTFLVKWWSVERKVVLIKRCRALVGSLNRTAKIKSSRMNFCS